jgi:hypothetical protein
MIPSRRGAKKATFCCGWTTASPREPARRPARRCSTTRPSETWTGTARSPGAFQVTPKGEIVWEYVSPIRAKGAVGGGGRQIVSNWLYRAAPVPYDWAPAGTPHAEPATMIPGEN